MNGAPGSGPLPWGHERLWWFEGWAGMFGMAEAMPLRLVALMRSLWGVSILQTHISTSRCGAPVLFCCGQMWATRRSFGLKQIPFRE